MKPLPASLRRKKYPGPPLKKLCAWCHPGKGGPGVSHGICAKHSRELLESMDIQVPMKTNPARSDLMPSKKYNGQKFIRIIPADTGVETWYPEENLKWLRTRTPFKRVMQPSRKPRKRRKLNPVLSKKYNGQKFIRIIPADTGVETWYPEENLKWLRTRTPFKRVMQPSRKKAVRRKAKLNPARSDLMPFGRQLLANDRLRISAWKRRGSKGDFLVYVGPNGSSAADVLHFRLDGPRKTMERDTVRVGVSLPELAGYFPVVDLPPIAIHALKRHIKAL